MPHSHLGTSITPCGPHPFHCLKPAKDQPLAESRTKGAPKPAYFTRFQVPPSRQMPRMQPRTERLSPASVMSPL